MDMAAAAIHALISCIVGKLVEVSGTPRDKLRDRVVLQEKPLKLNEGISGPRAKWLQATILELFVAIKDVGEGLAITYYGQTRLPLKVRKCQGKDGVSFFSD